MDRHARLFRRLLKLLPADFQADYARDMERTFRAQHHDAAGERGGLARLWLDTIRDMLRTAPLQHIDQFRQDARHGLRGMARRPGFAAVAALVFAIGIASTTAVFSLVNGAVLNPVPFDDPARLVAVREQTPQDSQAWELSYVSFLDLRRDARSFEEFAAYMRNGIVIGGREPQLTDAVLISANLLTTLRVQPVAGRGFREDEDRPGGRPVAVISHGLARTRFGSAAEAVGRALVIDDRPSTIVGVMGPSFRFPDRDAQVWLPIGQLADEPFMRNREVHTSLVVTRLRTDASIDSASAELTAWMDALHAREPAIDAGHRLIVRTLAEQVSLGVRPAVTALACATLLLLAVTCISVGLLLLTHAAGRTNEVAIRLSLGASRARLVRQLLTETTCLAAIGGAAGVTAAPVLLAFLVRGLKDALPPLVTPVVDIPALAIAAGTAALASIICSLAPAAQAVALVRTTTPLPHRSRQYLVATQVAVSCVLVVLAALLGRSLDRLLRVDMGFRPDRLLVMRVNAPAAGYPKPGDMTRFYQSVSTRLRALPGVTAVTATNRPPVADEGGGELTIEGQARDDAPTASYRRVLPGYFGVLGIPVLEGRDFTERDGSGEPVVIVSAALARRFWPPGQAVGKRIKVGPADRESWMRIVGVVGNVRNGKLEGGSDIATYEPHLQRPWNGMFVMVRTSRDALSMSATVRRALREIEPQVIVSSESTMEERIAESVAPRRFHATVVGLFASATLILVGLAIYGVLGYSVASRRREIGIKSAIGASASALARDVFAEGMRPTAAGLATGLVVSGIAATAARGLLFGITPADGWTYAITVIALVTVAGAACWLPAHRAAHVDPASALREGA